MSERGPGDERGRLGRQPGDSGRGDADPGVPGNTGDSGYRDQRNPESERAEYERGRADAMQNQDRGYQERGDQGQYDRQGSGTQQKSGTGWGIAALVVSILAFLVSFVGLIGFVLSIPALILGIVARRKGSRGLGLTAIILSVLAILISILITVVVGALILNNPDFQQQLQEIQQGQ